MNSLNKNYLCRTCPSVTAIVRLGFAQSPKERVRIVQQFGQRFHHWRSEYGSSRCRSKWEKRHAGGPKATATNGHCFGKMKQQRGFQQKYFFPDRDFIHFSPNPITKSFVFSLSSQRKANLSHIQRKTLISKNHHLLLFCTPKTLIHIHTGFYSCFMTFFSFPFFRHFL